jgi:hypothetical protein
VIGVEIAIGIAAGIETTVEQKCLSLQGESKLKPRALTAQKIFYFASHKKGTVPFSPFPRTKSFSSHHLQLLIKAIPRVSLIIFTFKIKKGKRFFPGQNSCCILIVNLLFSLKHSKSLMSRRKKGKSPFQFIWKMNDDLLNFYPEMPAIECL